MILIRLQGGLGNQLFQYAAALHLKQSINHEIAFFTDHLSLYETKRVFKLNFLFERESDIIFTQPSSLNKLILKYRINKIAPICFPRIITSKNINKSTKDRNYILDDYFQDIKLIQKGVAALTQLINLKANQPKYDLLLRKISDDDFANVVALHIRRGDYLIESNKKIYHILKDQYYINTIKQVFNNTSTILLFSEEQVEFDFKDMGQDIKVIFINGYNLSDIEEFLLMSRYKNIIIANSTFSFWAAISGTNAMEKKIIGPREWQKNSKINTLWLENMKDYRFNIFDNS